MAASDHLQTQLFDTAEYTKPEPKMDYTPESWVGRPDISWHASNDPQVPQEKNVLGDRGSKTAFGYGFHHGDIRAAMERGSITSPSQISSEDFNSFNKRDYLHPVRMTGETAVREEPREKDALPVFNESDSPEGRDRALAHTLKSNRHPMAFSDSEANVDVRDHGVDPNSRIGKALWSRGDIMREHLKAGRHLPYINAAETPGSFSYRSPRSSLNTWAEDVAADPGASRHHQLLAEQFDLTVPVTENWKARLNAPQPKQKPLARTAPGWKPPSACDLPGSLSGEAMSQGALWGHDAPIGQSNLTVMQPRMKRKADDGGA